MTIADILQVVAILLAGIGVMTGMRSNANARETQVIMDLFNRIQDEWISYWRDTLKALEAMTPDEVSNLQESSKIDDDLRRALNLLDWIGHLIRGGHLKQARTLYAVLASPLARTMRVAQPLLEKDIKEHGKEYWGGLLYLEKKIRHS